jgi:multisubunit Na+/H+ antiporter MnhB subunit
MRKKVELKMRKQIKSEIPQIERESRISYLYFFVIIMMISLIFLFFCITIIFGYVEICHSLNRCSIDDYKEIFFGIIALFFIIKIILLIVIILKSFKIFKRRNEKRLNNEKKSNNTAK